MATFKFKVGDRVKRIADVHCGMNTGDVGTVLDVNSTGNLKFSEPEYNQGSSGSADVWHAARKFELDAPTPTAAPDLKPTNPKDAIGNRKLQLGLVPFAFQALTALALTDGKYKYGAHNWTIGGVRASIYIDAAMRHLQRWNSGQAFDPDSGVHNLGHAAACIAILLDAETRGVLTDDRPPAMPVGVLDSFQQYANRHTGELIDGHVAAGRAPRHWTIEDSEGSGDAD